MLRYAVVGPGFWAPFQISGWNEVGGVECVAVCGRDSGRTEAFARKHRLRPFTDLDAMLSEVRPDFLDVITTVEAHADNVRAAARHRIPVICQKPMGRDLEEARSMAQACREAGVPLLIHENWRYQTPLATVGRLLREGRIGRPFRGRLQFSCSFPVFDNQPALAELDRFILTDIGTHVLDAARALFGEAESLVATTTKVNPRIKGEDVATVMMRMTGCDTVVCEMSYASRLADESFPETYVTVEAERGSIELRRGYRVLITTQEGTEAIDATPPVYPWSDPKYALVHSSIVDCNRALLRALQGGPAETSADDNLRTLELVFGAYDSAERNALIRL